MEFCFLLVPTAVDSKGTIQRQWHVELAFVTIIIMLEISE